jgi:hypothetical protein
VPLWNNGYWLEEEKTNEEKPHEFRIDSFEKEKFLTAVETNEAPF